MERHRHRFEFTIKYRDLFEKNGMICSGIHPKNNLVETIELKDHPWFICTQYHPEFKSKPVSPHPLFMDFIRASIEFGRSR
jgi:CTP synthase